MMISIPDYLVRKVSGFPGGIRMPKMEKYSLAEFINKGYTVTNILGEGDPLNGGDYRYWCGAQGSHWRKGWANCRACNCFYFTKKERKAHKQDGCGALLEEAYKMFRRCNECIICTLATHRKVYGLPLCCKDCESEWEYTTATPHALRQAMNKIKDAQKK